METLNPLSKFPLDLVLPFFAPIISINEEILQTFGLISTPKVFPLIPTPNWLNTFVPFASFLHVCPEDMFYFPCMHATDFEYFP